MVGNDIICSQHTVYTELRIRIYEGMGIYTYHTEIYTNLYFQTEPELSKPSHTGF